jgi:hypothetical protein
LPVNPGDKDHNNSYNCRISFNNESGASFMSLVNTNKKKKESDQLSLQVNKSSSQDRVCGKPEPARFPVQGNICQPDPRKNNAGPSMIYISDHNQDVSKRDSKYSLGSQLHDWKKKNSRNNQSLIKRNGDRLLGQGIMLPTDQ